MTQWIIQLGAGSDLLLICYHFHIFTQCRILAGVYHVPTDKPHKILYTAVDVISIVSMAFTTYIMIDSCIFNYSTLSIPYSEQTKWHYWLPFEFLAVRGLCLVGYKIARRIKKPSPASDASSETRTA